MSKFIVTRNGEHIGWHNTRPEAQAQLDTEKAHDQAIIGRWITAEQARRINYAIIERGKN